MSNVLCCRKSFCRKLLLSVMRVLQRVVDSYCACLRGKVNIRSSYGETQFCVNCYGAGDTISSDSGHLKCTFVIGLLHVWVKFYFAMSILYIWKRFISKVIPFCHDQEFLSRVQGHASI